MQVSRFSAFGRSGWREPAALLALLGGLGMMPGAAWAQQPDLDQTFLNAPNVLDGNLIRFCVYPESAIGHLEEELAHVLGAALLLEVEVVTVEPPIAIPGLDTIPISIEDLFLLLSNECDGFMGLELAPEAYPTWLTFTRPYFEAPYVAVARPGTFDSLEALTPDDRVATQSLTTGDIQFSAYNNALSEGQRVRRVPYPHTDLQFERLLDGSVDAAIVWEPWLRHPDIGVDGVEVIANGAIPLGTRSIGMGLRSRDTFLRTALDDAIALLEQDGTLAEVFSDAGFN